MFTIVTAESLEKVQKVCEEKSNQGQYPRRYPNVMHKDKKIFVKGFGYTCDRFAVLQFIPESNMREYVHITLSNQLDNDALEPLEDLDIISDESQLYNMITQILTNQS